MASYLVTYDLKQGNSSDYKELYDAIKSYRTWARLTESSWMVVTDYDQKEIRDHLGTFMKSGDRLFVLKSGKAAAWRNVRATSEWLKKWL